MASAKVILWKNLLTERKKTILDVPADIRNEVMELLNQVDRIRAEEMLSGKGNPNG